MALRSDGHLRADSGLAGPRVLGCVLGFFFFFEATFSDVMFASFVVEVGRAGFGRMGILVRWLSVQVAIYVQIRVLSALACYVCPCCIYFFGACFSDVGFASFEVEVGRVGCGDAGLRVADRATWLCSEWLIELLGTAWHGVCLHVFVQLAHAFRVAD